MTTFHLVFESEDKDEKGLIKPLIRAEITRADSTPPANLGTPVEPNSENKEPFDQSKLFKGLILDFPTSEFKTSAEKVFTAGQNQSL